MRKGWKACMKKIFGLHEITDGTANKKIPGNDGDGSTRILQPAHTLRLKPEPTIANAEERSPERMHLDWYGTTDRGLVRDHNEDFYSCLSLESESLFVVADGMGGHDAGDIASRIAAETVSKVVAEGVKRDLDPQWLIEHAVQRANTAVKREAVHAGTNMGTTLTAAFLVDTTAYVANVGDSRAYWIVNGSMTQVTEDHSLVAKLVAVGKLTKREARRHPKSNLLYRTVGTDEEVKVDTFRVELKRGGSLLLCSDGLWGEVDEDDIYRVFATEKNVSAACARLVKMANESGGRDNITVVAVRVV